MPRRAYVSNWQSGLPETPCGAGSKLKNTELIREYLPEILDRYKIRSVVDVGCGDRNWVKHVKLPEEITYLGMDIEPRQKEVIRFDCVRDVLAIEADLILCLYVLNHLDPQDAQDALVNFQKSKAKYLLVSNSDHDGFRMVGELIEGVHHKTTLLYDWHYNLWRLNP